MTSADQGRVRTSDALHSTMLGAGQRSRAAATDDSSALWLALSVVGVAAGLAGMWIPIEARGQIPFPCAFLSVTDWPCPFCGMTRAFLAAGHGMWAEAFRQSPIGALLYPGAWSLAVYSAIQLARGARATIRIPRWLWALGIAALLINWAYRVGASLR